MTSREEREVVGVRVRDAVMHQQFCSEALKRTQGAWSGIDPVSMEACMPNSWSGDG